MLLCFGSLFTGARGLPTSLCLTWTDDALIPLHLLIYATQTAVSTCACIADALTWDISTTQKISLGQLYVPYLLLCKSSTASTWLLDQGDLRGSRLIRAQLCLWVSTCLDDFRGAWWRKRYYRSYTVSFEHFKATTAANVGLTLLFEAPKAEQ